MASRFWAGSSDEEESDRSEASDLETNPQNRAQTRWAVESDSESEDEVRVVKSAKDKAHENIERSCGLIRNYIKINDWGQIQSEYDTMMKLIEKSKNVMSQTGYPKCFLIVLASLEDLLAETLKDKATQKKMGKENNKSFIRMKGKLKKAGEDFRKLIDEMRAKGDKSESESQDSDKSSSEASDEFSEEVSSDEESEDESSDEESDESLSEDQKSAGGEDSDEWPSESDSSSSEEEDNNELKGRAKWLKTATVHTKEKSVRGPKVPKAQKVRKSSFEARKVEEELKLTPAQFDRRMKEMVASRGRRSTNINEHLAQLSKLSEYARTLGPAREIIARMQLVGAYVYATSGNIDKVLPTEDWKTVSRNVDTILNLLEQNPGFSIVNLSDEEQADILRAGRGELKDDEIEMNLPKAGSEGRVPTSGNIAIFVERLQDEYVKSLQQIDPHTSEYVARLRDENLLVELAARSQSYFERTNDNAAAASLALMQIEFTYYKHSTIAQAIYASEIQRQTFGDPEFFHPACSGCTESKPVGNFDKVHPASISGEMTCDVRIIDFEKILKNLCLFVYQYGEDRAKTRAMLCQIYYHALHGRFYDARDLLLMSHLQETIPRTDIPTQVLFNRMMVQLGICAFTHGLISEAHGCLMEICSSSRVRELLAQGVQYNKYNEKGSVEEKAERRRQVPYHMHINMELLESCHITSAMLLEIPNMASPSSHRIRLISKHFRRYFEYYRRQLFNGPPENTRDNVIAAAKALSEGTWSRASELILGLPVWDLLPGENAAKNIREILRVEIRVQALRSYLLAYSSQYESISLHQVCDMFDLEEKKVYSVVSRMMINEKLLAAWDQRTQSIIMHNVDQTKLQDMALQMADKLNGIVEGNERILDARAGGAFNKDDNFKGRSSGPGENNRNRGYNNRDGSGGGGRGGGGYHNRDAGGGGGRGGYNNYRDNREGGGGGRGGFHHRDSREGGGRGGYHHRDGGGGGGSYNQRDGDRGGRRGGGRGGQARSRDGGMYSSNR